jgi:hypothetical protein
MQSTFGFVTIRAELSKKLTSENTRFESTKCVRWHIVARAGPTWRNPQMARSADKVPDEGAVLLGMSGPVTGMAERRNVHRTAVRAVRFLVEGTLALALAAFNVMPAMSQPFQPIRKLTTWYTDRSLVDIEIIGSTSLPPDRHELEPERVLRFRLERAYVQTLIAERGPGFEIVTFGFDMETGLADSLILAMSQTGRVHEDIPGVPVVSLTDQLKRTLLVSLQSDESAAALQRASEAIGKCRGAAIQDDLLTFEWAGRPNCRKPSFPRGAQYVAIHDDLMLRIECHEESFPGIGCDLRFPFEGFAARVTFHRDHLLKWREIVDRVARFLNSKQYR